MLRQLSWQDQSDSGLDLSGRDGGLLVVGSQLGGLGGDSLEDVVDKGVHDGHGLLGDTGVRVGLLQDLVDVGGVGLLSGLGSLLGLGGGGGLLAGGLLLGGSLGCYFLFCLRCHGVCVRGGVGWVQERAGRQKGRAGARSDTEARRPGPDLHLFLYNARQRALLQHGAVNSVPCRRPWLPLTAQRALQRGFMYGPAAGSLLQRGRAETRPAHDLSSSRVNVRPRASPHGIPSCARQTCLAHFHCARSTPAPQHASGERPGCTTRLVPRLLRRDNVPAPSAHRHYK